MSINEINQTLTQLYPLQNIGHGEPLYLQSLATQIKQSKKNVIDMTVAELLEIEKNAVNDYLNRH
jgi:hypothetical protein